MGDVLCVRTHMMGRNRRGVNSSIFYLSFTRRMLDVGKKLETYRFPGCDLFPYLHCQRVAQSLLIDGWRLRRRRKRVHVMRPFEACTVTAPP